MPAKRYGAQHQRLRAQWKPIVDAGGVPCSRCGLPIVPGTRWHLDHVDGGFDDEYWGPSHAACNTSAPHTRAGRARAYGITLGSPPPAPGPGGYVWME